MTRSRGSNWKKSRRLGTSSSGTGEELEKHPCVPGQHGPNQRKKLSEYGLRSREKQKLRYLYGMTERQSRNTFDIAGKQHGVHGEDFMILLVGRLDAVVYSLGLARIRRQARQLVGYGHIEVDGRRINIPSCALKSDRVTSAREKSRSLDIIKEFVEISDFALEYLNLDADSLKGTFVRLSECNELPAKTDEQLIVKYYSR